MNKKSKSNRANLEKTRKMFVDIAKKEFVENGFSGASTADIVEKSGMARGSLYYHFGDKRGLFKAVYKSIANESAKKILSVTQNYKAPIDSLYQGCLAYIKLFEDRAFRKIILIEAQTALPYADRMEIQDKGVAMLLRTLIESAQKDGYFKNLEKEPLAILITGIVGEIGRTLHFSKNKKNDMKKYIHSFEVTFGRIAKIT